MTSLSPSPILQFFDANSIELVGGLLFTYAAGTTTKINVYTDNTGTTTFTNPIVLNARGEPTYDGASTGIWLVAGTAYKYVLSPPGDTDPPTNAIWTLDNITTGASGGAIAFVADTGTVNALAVALSPAPSGYTAGMQFFVQVANTNTGASTINVNALGAKNITINGAPLNAGALQDNQVYLLVYDGTAFELQSIPGPGGWVTNADLAPMPTQTVKGNITGGTATPTDIPVGSITGGFAPGEYRYFAAASAVPASCLVCNGQAVSRTAFPALYGAIGTTYGIGDGTTTFNVPNLAANGAVLRAFNSTGTGPAPTAPMGTLQADAMQGHLHGPPSGSTAYFAQVGSSTESTEAGNNATPDNKFTNTGTPVTDSFNGTPRTSTETRMVNFSAVIAIQT